MTKPISSEKYLRGAGLALKAGERGEAAEFFLKGGGFEPAALLFEKLERPQRGSAPASTPARPRSMARRIAFVQSENLFDLCAEP